MSDEKQTYDPAFIAWWKQKTLPGYAAPAFSLTHYAAQAWEEATRLVKTDCAAMHSEETGIRNTMLDALTDAERELSFLVESMNRGGGLYEKTLNKVRAAIAKATTGA